MSELETLFSRIDEFSLVDFSPPEELATQDFQDILLEVASSFRSREITYVIEFKSPPDAPYRLRSEQKPPQTANNYTVNIVANKQLKITAGDLEETNFKGVVEELKLIGRLIFASEETKHRTTELNIFKKQAFEAELNAEYHRWDRYESAFWIVKLDFDGEVNWREVTRELKHLSKLRDKIGLIDRQSLAAFLPSRSREDETIGRLKNRIGNRFPEEKFNLQAKHVPTDIENWKQILKLLEE